MMRIETKTTMTPYRANVSSVKPDCPDFIFRNSGNTIMYINNMPVPPGDVFGRTMETLVATLAAAGVEATVAETTEFALRFDSTVAAAYVSDPEEAVVQLCTLIKTEYKIYK